MKRKSSSVTFEADFYGLLHFAKSDKVSAIMQYIFDLVVGVEARFPLNKEKQQLVWNFYEHPDGEILAGEVHLMEIHPLIGSTQIEGDHMHVKVSVSNFAFHLEEQGGRQKISKVGLLSHQGLADEAIEHLLKKN